MRKESATPMRDKDGAKQLDMFHVAKIQVSLDLPHIPTDKSAAPILSCHFFISGCLLNAGDSFISESYIPAPSVKCCARTGRCWRRWEPGGTSQVIQRLPPTTESWPMRMRPRMVLFE